MGLFSPRYEVSSIHRGVDTELVRFSGTTVDWYVFDSATTTADDIYGWGEGRVWQQPMTFRVVDAIEMEGAEQPYEQGLFTRNRLKVVLSSEELVRHDFISLFTEHTDHLRDRFVYDGRVYSPSDFVIGGDVREQMTIVAVTAQQVRKDELVNDPTFAAFAD